MPDPPRSTTTRVGDFRVGEWLAEPALNRLTTGQTVLRMRPQLMDVLVCLARHQGRVVLKDELLAEVWPDRIITESGMVRCIAELRQLLGDDSHEPRYIQTIAKRGYRLVADVQWLGRAQPEAAEPVAPSEFVSSPGPVQPVVPATMWWQRHRGLVVTGVSVLAGTIAAVALMVMWQPATTTLTERDTVVLAFENTTGDRAFDDPLPLALAIQLEQSPFLQIVPSERVRQTLTLMKRAPDTAVTRQLGLEICERLAASALIVGSLGALGQDFVIGLEAVACSTGDTLGRQQVQVAAKNGVLGGLARAASQLRRDLGESLTSIQAYDTPVVEATTSSLDALRALRQGDRARDRGQNAEALRLYREAVAFDPEFALAHARVGAYAMAQLYETEALAALERAFALRDRVTFPERLEIDLLYHANVTGDQREITETLETMRRVYPRRLGVRRRLAAHYLNIGRFEDALVEALAAHELEPRSAPSFTTVGRAYFVLNRLVDARGTAEDAIGLGIDNESHHHLLLQVGFLTQDATLVARERAWAATHADAIPAFEEAEAEEAVWRGGLRDALAHLDRYQALALERGAEHQWIVLELRKARYEALCGWTTRASHRMRQQLARPGLGNDLKIDALKVAVSAGDVGEVERIIAALDRAGWPKAEQPYAGFVLAYRAALETDRGHPDRALELLEPMIPFELGMLWGFIPLHERARAHLRAGNWEQARDAYQKMLANPGVVSGQKLLPLAQLGVARAWRAGGKTAESRAAYEAFAALWKDADPDLPLLADARREYSRLK